MLSKSQISFLKSLQEKKQRKVTQLFLVEGIKSITEFISSNYVFQEIFVLEEYYYPLRQITVQKSIPTTIISDKELRAISLLENPQHAIAILQMPTNEPIIPKTNYLIALDNIQDPGNLGTIIRTADWFGMHHIIASIDTVEAYNPKVLQASMGSLARVKVLYLNLEQFFRENSLPVYGTLLNASSLFHTQFEKKGIILMGNEGKGISPSLMPYLTKAITIPKIGGGESLNVAVATSILCAEIARQNSI